MRKLQAVIFDLDDTLVDRRAAFRAVAEQLYYSQPPMLKTHSLETAVRLLIHFDTFDDRFDRILMTWPGIPMSASELRVWYYEALTGALKPDESALSLLVDLNKEGLPWGIVTNGGAFQHTKLKLTGVQELAPFTIVSGDFGHEKPDPAIYVEARKRLGEPPAGEILFVGDNPDTDIKGAQGVGMLTAWIHLDRRFPEHFRAPDYVLGHVDELRPLLLGKREI